MALTSDHVKKRLLVVEDALEIKTLLAGLLESAGYEVDCASNGKEALEHLQSTSHLPALILLDLMMPDMDGYQFCERHRINLHLADIPVVVMSAGGDMQAKAERVGAKAYLKKPFLDIDTILRTIAGVLEKKPEYV